MTNSKTSVLSSPPAQILVTDDDSSIRALLVLALEEEGYIVTEAVNGKDCLAKVSQRQPDLILLDAMMPEMDGFVCCQELRALAEQVPVLMITFLDDRESIDQAFVAGATDYITKPIHWSVLRQRVRRLLQGSSPEPRLQAWQMLLHHLLASLAQSQDRSTAIETFLHHLKDFFALERAVFCSFTPMRIWESANPQAPGIETLSVPWQSLALERTDSTMIAVIDLTKSQLPLHFRQEFARLNCQSLLIKPLLQQDQVWGVIHLHGAIADRPWDEWELARLEDLSNLLRILYG